MSTLATSFRGCRARLRKPLTAALGSVVLAAPLVAVAGPAEAAPRVSWSDLSVVAGKSVVATVKPASIPQGAEAVLQRKFPDRWRVADGTATSGNGGLRLTVPTDQYGQFVYRVAAVDGDSVLDTSDAVTMNVKPPYDPQGAASSYAFLSSPRWRWDSCSVVTWRYNDARSPRSALTQIKGAFGRVHAATGIEFRYLGKTTKTAAPGGRGGQDIILGWLSNRTFRNQYGGAIAVGGASYFTGYTQANGDNISRAVSGGVALSAGFNDNLRKGFGSGFTWGEVLMHEIGHVMGLDHANSSKQLMFPRITSRAAKWGAGDLRGFRLLGDTQGCVTPRANRINAEERTIVVHHDERYRLPRAAR